MGSFFHKFIFLTGLSLVLVAYMNCGDDFSSDGFGNSSSSSVALDCDTDCLQKTSENLEINIGDGAEIFVSAGTQYLNVSGDCNDANYRDSRILWQVDYQGATRFVGEAPGCDEGRYYLLVDLTASGRGLSVGNARAAHNLVVELVAFDDGLEIRNISKAKRSIQLIPH